MPSIRLPTLLSTYADSLTFLETVTRDTESPLRECFCWRVYTVNLYRHFKSLWFRPVVKEYGRVLVDEYCELDTVVKSIAYVMGYGMLDAYRERLWRYDDAPQII